MVCQRIVEKVVPHVAGHVMSLNLTNGEPEMNLSSTSSVGIDTRRRGLDDRHDWHIMVPP
jgi:hypothetical protein